MIDKVFKLSTRRATRSFGTAKKTVSDQADDFLFAVIDLVK